MNDSSNEESKFATKNVMLGKYDQNNSIIFVTESIKSSLCDYCDPFMLVIGNIKATANNNTDVVFKTFCTMFYM